MPSRAASFGTRKMPTVCIPKFGYLELLNMKSTRIIAAGRAAKKKQAHHTLLLLTVLWNSVMAHPRLSSRVPSFKVCPQLYLLQSSLLLYLKANHPSDPKQLLDSHLSLEMITHLCDEKHACMILCLKYDAESLLSVGAVLRPQGAL